MVEQNIKSFTLINRSGAKVVLGNLGAGIISVDVPDRNGVLADVVLGYGSLESYFNDGPCMGKVPGRFANRIAGGRFTLDGLDYSLAVNNGPNHLHGGPHKQSYANRIWHGVQRDNEVFFTLKSPAGDAGYPSALSVEAHYVWSDDNRLSLDFTAVSDGPTVVNLTNHAYFNLKGESAGDITDHCLKLCASRYVSTDKTLIPNGELPSVTGTPMDFTSGATIGDRLHSDFPELNYGKGYDTCFAIDGYDGSLRLAATLSEASSGRSLNVYTDAPGIQLYTGNWLKGCPGSISGGAYNDYDGVALECQSFPDSPNHPLFPFTPLMKGSVYSRTIIYEFK